MTYSIREAPNNTIRTWKTRVAATVEAIALKRINYSVTLTIPPKSQRVSIRDNYKRFISTGWKFCFKKREAATRATWLANSRGIAVDRVGSGSFTKWVDGT